jgi:RNA-directed DNA polymerase
MAGLRSKVSGHVKLRSGSIAVTASVSARKPKVFAPPGACQEKPGLIWFDKAFHWASGPAHLVRYAGDFVVLARDVSPKLKGYIEEKLEFWTGLEINREKTRVMDLKQKGASLDLLGFTFRYDRSQYGAGRYLNVAQSKKALKREREKLGQMTSRSNRSKPIPTLIEGLNRHLRGWANYFRFGYPREAFDQINRHVLLRLGQHLRRRSQRPFRPPKGVTLYEHYRRMGLGSS